MYFFIFFLSLSRGIYQLTYLIIKLEAYANGRC